MLGIVLSGIDGLMDETTETTITIRKQDYGRL